MFKSVKKHKVRAGATKMLPMMLRWTWLMQACTMETLTEGMMENSKGDQ